MASKLIIIRGNSGSGKSTIAKLIRKRLGRRTILLQQDVLRREILKVEDKAGNPMIGLLEELVGYGERQKYDIIIEGILSENKYGNVLRSFLRRFDDTYVYYLNVPFDETLRRHTLKSNSHEFGEKEMREWWTEKDYLHVDHEQILQNSSSAEETAAKILQDMESE